MRYLFLLLLTFSLYAKQLHYRVKAPLFGTIGNVAINYTVTNNKYDITAHMQTSGFAKTLSGNRVEDYHIAGAVKRNRYFAHNFMQKVKFKQSIIHLQYLFDYKKKTIENKRVKWKNGKKINDTDIILPFFASNDLFSSYHNIVERYKGGNNPGHYTIKSAGLEKFNGILKIFIPSKAQQIQEARALGVKDVWVFHIITQKKILGSENGEIIFAVGSDGIAKAVRVLNTSYVSHIDAFLVH